MRFFGGSPSIAGRSIKKSEQRGSPLAMSKTTFVTWLWNGWRPLYGKEHVVRMRDMLREHVSFDHDFVCITDQGHIPGIETYPLWRAPDGLDGQELGKPSCYARLRLFSPWAKRFGERLISIDLDTIILGDITDLFDDSPFRIKKAKCCPYNGSLWQVRPAQVKDIWQILDVRTAARSKRRHPGNKKPWVGSDQAYMAYMLPGVDTWHEEHGIRWYADVMDEIQADTRMILYPGSDKPWDSQYAGLYWGRS